MKAFWVTKRLAFGSAITTKWHVEQLQAIDITHVINLRHGKHGKKIRQFESLWLPLRDNKKPRPNWFYKRALRFYEKAMRNEQYKVFIMCHHGICRSPSLVYFFLRSSWHNEVQVSRLVRKARKRAQIVRAYHQSCEEFLFLNDIAQE
jgi:hypothetical protein